MEIKKRFNPRFILVVVYFVAFGSFLKVNLKTAEATVYSDSLKLTIPSIELDVETAKLELQDNRLETPSEIVGSYSMSLNKTLLIAHSNSAFKNLNEIELGDEIIYGDTIYTVADSRIIEKAQVNMYNILKAERKDTLVLMTCAGTDLADRDATHRLVITAVVE